MEEEEERERGVDEGERTGGVQEVERESLCWGLDTLWYEVEIGGLDILGILNFPKD